MAIIGYYCGCPVDQCSGSASGNVSASMRSIKRKIHGSRAEARRCYINHLLKQGYRRSDNSSTFLPPEGSDLPAIVISKLTKFGGELRTGKEKRYMPKNRTGGMVY